MKLSDLAPQLPRLAKYEQQLNTLTGALSQIYKSSGETYRAPTIGVDRLVSHWLRQQTAYRQQFIRDINDIASSVSEIASPVHHIISEVFRKGIHWASAFAVKCKECDTEYQEEAQTCKVCQSKELQHPDEDQKKNFEPFLDDCNIWDQSLESVLKGYAWSFNTVDDAFLYLSKEYKEGTDGEVHSKVVEIRNLNAAFIEYDLDANGLPKNSHFICYIHRDVRIPSTEPGKCPDCDRTLVPVMYIYRHQGRPFYLLDSEIIHNIKFWPGNELYGWSPILTIMEKVLTIIGMDRCYDEETEVLTKNGWKHFRDVNYDDEFATRDNVGRLVYQRPTTVNQYYHSGPMYQVKNGYVDLLVTPHHRMYVKTNQEKEYEFFEAQDIEGHVVFYKVGDDNCENEMDVLVNATQKDDSWIDYEGMTYCVEIPDSVLYVRRNGKSVWSGNTLYRYFFERKVPSGMIFVFTDDVDSIRMERAEIEAKLSQDISYVPMVGVQTRTNRGRVDFVRLFHTLQEMDYLPVRQEIRERIAAMWGVSPIWQGSLEATGGIASQTQQLVVMSRVVEGDQRIFHEKVFPQILEAFGITDWKLELPQPEEKAESTRLQFAMQRISAAMQLSQMGMDIEAVSDGGVSIDDINFKVSGKAKSQVDQQKEMVKFQMEQQQKAQAAMGGGGLFGGGGAPGGGFPGQEGETGDLGPSGSPGEASEEKGTAEQLPSFLQRAHEKRFFDKLRSDPSLMNDLLQKGFTTPLIKSFSPDGSNLIFESAGKLYNADVEGTKVVNISKHIPAESIHQHGSLPPHAVTMFHEKPQQMYGNKNPYADDNADLME